MLSGAFRKHVEEQAERRKMLDNKKVVALEALAKASDAMVERVNSGVAEVFHNQRALEVESHALQQETQRFVKQTNQWLHLMEGFNNALKDLGDVEYIAQTLEADMQHITTSLEFITRPAT